MRWLLANSELRDRDAEHQWQQCHSYEQHHVDGLHRLRDSDSDHLCDIYSVFDGDCRLSDVDEHTGKHRDADSDASG